MKSCFHSKYYYLKTVFTTTRKVCCNLKKKNYKQTVQKQQRYVCHFGIRKLVLDLVGGLIWVVRYWWEQTCPEE